MFGVYSTVRSLQAFLQFYPPLKYGGLLSFGAEKEIVRLKNRHVERVSPVTARPRASEKAQHSTRTWREAGGTAPYTARSTRLSVRSPAGRGPYGPRRGVYGGMRGHFTDPELSSWA